MWAVPQSIKHPLGVTVYGSALVRTEPDIAEAWIAINRVAKEPAEAFEQTRAAVQAVRQALLTSGIDAGAVEASRVSVDDAFEGVTPNRRLVGYRAGVTFRIRIGNVDLVEPVLVSAVAAGANHIQRVSYQTSELRDLRMQARRSAVAAAAEKAEAYCEAAGCRLGEVIHIEDVDPDTANQQLRGHAAGGGEPQDASAASSLGSGSLTVAAAVMVVHTLLPIR